MIPGGEAHARRHERELRAFFALQRSAVLPEGSVTIDRFDLERWNRELGQIVYGLAHRTNGAFAREIADRYGVQVNVDDLRDFLRPYARITAEATNATTADGIRKALEAEEDTRLGVEHVFAIAMTSRAVEIAASKVTTEANLGRSFGAQEGGETEKHWVTTSGRPRASHAQMNGESTGIREPFSNGAQWPGDPILEVGERANCSCMVDFG